MMHLVRNPVLLREARVRMRGWRTPALIMLYVTLLSLFVIVPLYIAVQFEGSTFSPSFGGALYNTLAFAQLALLIFTAPGLTAGTIAGERERQTLDLLLITRMSPIQVVVGKLGAALAFTVLLMVVSLPVYGVLFMVGGVALERLLYTAIVYVVTVLFLGSIGTYFSALFRRTQAAVVATYGAVFGIIIGSFILTVLIFEVFYRGRTPTDITPSWAVILAYINPVIALASAAGGPLEDITQLYRRVLTTPEMREAIWWKYCLLGLSMTAGLLWLTARKIAPLKNKE